MKKLFFIAIGALFIGAGTLSSCSKYAEGPKLALSSKTSRLAGTWVLSAKTLNGVNAVENGYTETLIIEKDGTFRDTAKINLFNFTYVGGVTGVWSFSEDKMQVVFNSTGTNTAFTINGNNTWNIIKLAKDEIKFEKIGSNNSVTAMTYVPQN
ncbi:MAG: hypothetical protein ACKOWW_06075 [Flavobacteriales bacterium]